MESATCCGMESDQRSEWNQCKALYGIIAKAMYEEPYSAAPFLERALSVRYFIKVFSEKVLTKRKKLDIILWQVDNHTCGEVLKW